MSVFHARFHLINNARHDPYTYLTPPCAPPACTHQPQEASYFKMTVLTRFQSNISLEPPVSAVSMPESVVIQPSFLEQFLWHPYHHCSANKIDVEDDKGCSTSSPSLNQLFRAALVKEIQAVASFTPSQAGSDSSDASTWMSNRANSYSNLPT